MRFSLIICTYMRPLPLLKLLQSVKKQTIYPNEILIIDGSLNNQTQTVLEENNFKNLKYFKVDKKDRGLTRQRNLGIEHVSNLSEIICFLDDDTELIEDYFEQVMKTFINDSIVGVGGVAVNENRWFKITGNKLLSTSTYYSLSNYAIKESFRNILRNKMGLQSDMKPGFMPNFSHGRTYSYPLDNKIYPVDLLVGMSFSFRKDLFHKIKFSTYFEGYGLYEDADFSIRSLKYGVNVVNTAAKLYHYHDSSGRPNKFKYGKMVIRNGWYVWRLKYSIPTFKARFKWHATSFLLTLIRFTNIISTNKKREAFTESFGRIVGWFSLIFNAPKIK